MDESSEQIKNRVENALGNDDLDNIYFNGFVLTLGTGDIAIVLERNGRPKAVVNTSYTVAKTLASKLQGLVADLEQKTGNTIMSTDDVKERLQRPNGDDNV